MNTVIKRRIIIVVISILLVINISALATFLYNNFTREKRYDEIRKVQKEVQISGVHRYLREELKLSDDQFMQFREKGRDNFQKSREIAVELDEKRIEFIDELTKENPDSIKLNSIAKEIGNLHYELKNNTIKHYFELKKICNPEQQKGLETLFMKMIQREDRPEVHRPERGFRPDRNRDPERNRNWEHHE